MKYAISITETLGRVVVVEAKDEDSAEDIVKDMWAEGDIILDHDDFGGFDVQYEPMYIIDNKDKVINE